MNKLTPKIKLGCSSCNKLLQDNLQSNSFNITEPKYNKVVTIIGPKRISNKSKTISLF